MASSSILELTQCQVVVKDLSPCRPGSLIEVFDLQGHRCQGLVKTVWNHRVTADLLDEPTGISKAHALVRILDASFCWPVFLDVLGRALDGSGKPLDSLPEPMVDHAQTSSLIPKAMMDRSTSRRQLFTHVPELDQQLPLMAGSRVLLLAEKRDTLWSGAQRLLSSLMNMDPSCCTILARGELSPQEKTDLVHLYTETSPMARMTLLLCEKEDPYCTLGLLEEQAVALGEHLAFSQGKDVFLFLDPGRAMTEESRMRIEALLGRAGMPSNGQSSLTLFYLLTPGASLLKLVIELSDSILFFEDSHGVSRLAADQSYSRFTG